nr:MAG TPA: hypothetical protein [Caudoviricetes sp.]
MGVVYFFFFDLNTLYFNSFPPITDQLPYPAVFRRRGRIITSRPKNEHQAFAISPSLVNRLQHSPYVSTALAVNISLAST